MEHEILTPRPSDETISPVGKIDEVELLDGNKSLPYLKSKRANPLRLPGFDAHNPMRNNLLAALPDSDLQKFLPHLELVSMPINLVVCEGNELPQHVYFPTNSIVSLLYETQDGASVETAIVGREGLVGVNCFMGGGANQCRAIVKSAGYGFRSPVGALKEVFAHSSEMQQIFLCYANALFSQASQMAVCNRHHNVPQQLCRLLLMSLDRMNSNEIFMKQGSIAAMLGVRRESVTAAAAALQSDHLIHYQRGHITVTDRAGLEQRACECYAVVKKGYDHLSSICAPEHAH
jgi:CRP-like cAMP-binding protein